MFKFDEYKNEIIKSIEELTEEVKNLKEDREKEEEEEKELIKEEVQLKDDQEKILEKDEVIKVSDEELYNYLSFHFLPLNNEVQLNTEAVENLEETYGEVFSEGIWIISIVIVVVVATQAFMNQVTRW